MTLLEHSHAQPPKSLYEPEPAEVVSVEKLTDLENLYTLRFVDGHPLRQDPGQFVQVALLGIGECPISIASSPTRPETFDLCIRRVGEVTADAHLRVRHSGEAWLDLGADALKTAFKEGQEK